jgi:hypothetical protein
VIEGSGRRNWNYEAIIFLAHRRKKKTGGWDIPTVSDKTLLSAIWNQIVHEKRPPRDGSSIFRFLKVMYPCWKYLLSEYQRIPVVLSRYVSFSVVSSIIICHLIQILCIYYWTWSEIGLSWQKFYAENQVHAFSEEDTKRIRKLLIQCILSENEWQGCLEPHITYCLLESFCCQGFVTVVSCV